MLSNINVKPAPNQPDAEAAMLSTSPETESFDFMDYILGLQETSTEGDTAEVSADPLAALIKEGIETKGKDNSKDGEALMASLLPGLTVPRMILPEVKTDESAATRQGAGDSSPHGLPEHTLVAPSVRTEENISQLEMMDSEVALAEIEEPVMAEAVSGETDKVAGMRAFQSQLAAVSVEKKGSRSDSRDSAETQDLALPAPSSVFTNLPEGELKTGANQEAEASVPAQIPELLTHVETLARQGGGTMTVTLNPPELGQVQVEVTTRGKQVQVELTSDSDFAKSVLESKLGELKASIQTHDLVVSKLEVNIDRDLGKQFSNASMGSWGEQQKQAFANLSDNSRSGSHLFSGNNRLTGRTSGISNFARTENVGLAQRPWNGRLDMRI